MAPLISDPPILTRVFARTHRQKHKRKTSHINIWSASQSQRLSTTQRPPPSLNPAPAPHKTTPPPEIHKQVSSNLHPPPKPLLLLWCNQEGISLEPTPTAKPLLLLWCAIKKASVSDLHPPPSRYYCCGVPSRRHQSYNIKTHRQAPTHLYLVCVCVCACVSVRRDQEDRSTRPITRSRAPRPPGWGLP